MRCAFCKLGISSSQPPPQGVVLWAAMEDSADQPRLYTADVAALLNVKPGTLRSYVSRGQMPAPDGADRLKGLWWHEATLTAWERPGRGNWHTARP